MNLITITSNKSQSAVSGSMWLCRLSIDNKHKLKMRINNVCFVKCFCEASPQFFMRCNPIKHGKMVMNDALSL